MSRPTQLRVGVYCRISQDSDGLGLGVARQEMDCRELVNGHGWSVHDTYVDNDQSAFTGKRRPSYERLLADLTAGEIDAVVVWHQDRLTRHPRSWSISLR